MYGLLFLSNLYAADAAAPSQGGVMGIVPIILIMVVFYFLLIRPQQKKEKERVAMISATKVGDKIVTSGGIVGTVKKVSDNNEIEVQIAENTIIKILKSHIIENYTATAALNNSKNQPSKSKK